MVYVLLGEGFEEMEAVIPVDLLRRAGVDVTTVGLMGREVTGGRGMTLTADITLTQVDPDQMEMLVLPGGTAGVDAISQNIFAVALVQRAYDQGAHLAAICAAPTILARLGMLDRRRGVCYPGMEEEMGSAIVPAGETVVQDGRIITAQAAGSSFDFGLKLIEVLKGAQVAEQVRQGVHY